MIKTTVKIENYYEDGHESTHEVELDGPECPGHPADEYGPAGVETFCDGTCLNGLDDWWDEVVWPETGDGHGKDNDLGTCFVGTIVKSNVRELVGKTYEWTSS